MTQKYERIKELFGDEIAEDAYKASIVRAKKEDKIRRLKTSLLHMDAGTVGQAYQNVLALDLNAERDTPPQADIWKAENAILRIQLLEMEC